MDDDTRELGQPQTTYLYPPEAKEDERKAGVGWPEAAVFCVLLICITVLLSQVI